MWFLGASCKLLSLSSIMALKFLAVSSRAFLDLICISSSPLRQWPGKVSRFLSFSPFFVSSFLNFSCFVEGPPWPHLHFFVSFRQKPCKISKLSLFSLFSLFRGGPSWTSFAFPRHFSSMALQNFEVFCYFVNFCSFHSYRCFVEGLSGPYLHFLVTFPQWSCKILRFLLFPDFRSTLTKFCNFCNFVTEFNPGHHDHWVQLMLIMMVFF